MIRRWLWRLRCWVVFHPFFAPWRFTRRVWELERAVVSDSVRHDNDLLGILKRLRELEETVENLREATLSTAEDFLAAGVDPYRYVETQVRAGKRPEDAILAIEALRRFKALPAAGEDT